MEAIQTVNSPNFETVWAILQKVAESQKETAKRQEETDRQMKETTREIKESQKETDRQMKETAREIKESQKETDRLLKESIAEYNKRFGDMDNRFGEVVESLLSPTLIDRFIDLGLVFQTASTNFKVKDHKNKIYFEIDVFLQNGDTSMLVEIKTNLTISYINEHINRLEKMRAFADLHKNSEPWVRRAFLGAVAGVVVPLKVKNYALENGLYLIEPAGENLNITPPNNKPKVW